MGVLSVVSMKNMTMQKCFSIFFVLTVVTVIIPYLMVEWFKHKGRLNVINNFNMDDVYQYEDAENHSEGLLKDACEYPLVFRNVVDWGDMDHCRLNDSIESIRDGRCSEFIKARLMKFFGNRTVTAAPPMNWDTLDFRTIQAKAATLQTQTTLNEFFTDEQWSRYALSFLTSLGSIEEYKRFLDFTDGDKTKITRNITSGGCNHNDVYCVADENPNFNYIITTLFITHLQNSGSYMHYALGKVLFTQLAGRKRWLFVNPAYLTEANCQPGYVGGNGGCMPGGYVPSVDNVSVAEYKRILLEEQGVPEVGLIDITLEPGDMLINCALWAHTVENLDGNSVGFAVRGAYENRPWNDFYFTQSFVIAIVVSLKTKFVYGEWQKTTFLDIMYVGLKNFLTNKFGSKENYKKYYYKSHDDSVTQKQKPTIGKLLDLF